MIKHKFEIFIATFLGFFAGLDLIIRTHDQVGWYLSLANLIICAVCLVVLITKTIQEKSK